MPMDLLRRAEGADEPGVAREAIESALKASSDRIWVHRNAARICRERLDDVPMAKRVLERLEPLTGIEWRLTAAAWQELGDRDRATECLEKAASNARTATDLCMVALGYRECGFPDEGRLLADGAESIASRAIDCWTVANVRREFAAPSLPVLERGLADTTDAIEIITFAHALAAYDADKETLAATLGRAELRASTVEGWLALALAHDQLLDDRDAAVACVASASKLSISAQHERAIGVMRARVGVMQLLDEDRPRLQPSHVLRPGARTFGFARDPATLLGWVRSRMPRTSIDALAQPGMFMFNDDLVTLLEIQRTGAIPHPLPGYLEHLNDVARGIGPGEDRLTRVFACALLCVDDASAETPGGHEGTMAMLLSTCLELGAAAVEGAVGLFAALADAYDATYATTRVGYLALFAELGLALSASWLDPSDPRIDAVIDRLIRDEPRHRERGAKSNRWLLGLAERDGGIPGQQRIWPSLASEMLEHPRQQRLRDRLVS